MKSSFLCLGLAGGLGLAGCGVSGFRVTVKDGAPTLPAASSTEVVDAAPSGAQELGKVEVIGQAGDACKTEVRDRARAMGATHVVVNAQPPPFSWQNTQKATLEAPRCSGTAFAAAAGSAPASPPASEPAGAPPSSPAPAPAAPAPPAT